MDRACSIVPPAPLDASRVPLEGRAPLEVRPRLFQFGAGCLELVDAGSAVSSTLEDVYAGCRVDEGASVLAAVVRQDDNVVSIRIREPGLDLAAVAYDLLRHQHLGGDVRIVASAARRPGWRSVAYRHSPDRPFTMISRGEVLVDLDREPFRYGANMLVSATMRAQRGLSFVHAGSAAINGRGLILAGRSMAGKTTLSLALATRGADIFGDDIAAIRPSTAEIFPFRRCCYVRPGPRARALGSVLQNAEPAHFGDARDDAAPRLRLDLQEAFPLCASGPVPLECVFFLRGFASQARIMEFSPGAEDFEQVLRPLAFDDVVAASWGERGSWLIHYLGLLSMLGKLRCYHVEAGSPDATTDAITALVEKD
jgi:hypothetical protein